MLGIALTLLLATTTAPVDEDVFTPAQIARIEARNEFYEAFIAKLARSDSPRDWALSAKVLDLVELMGNSDRSRCCRRLAKFADVCR